MQSYQYTQQAASDTGSSSKEAKQAGATEAFKTIMTGPQSGGPRGAGERIYSDYQRAQQFAETRNNPGGAANSMAAPPKRKDSAW